MPTLKPPFIAGNWKMHMISSEARDLASALVKGSLEFAEAEVVLIPPFTALAEVRKMTRESSVQVGGQNMHWEDKGAFTGEVSPLMLKDLGCRYVVVGHSERRHVFNEKDESIQKKVLAALKHGLSPILCVGETLEEREKGETMRRISAQLEAGLLGIEKNRIPDIVFAYEPVWAIGTGKTASPAQAEEVHAFIRGRLEEKYGKEKAGCAILLYGGSVKPDNAYSLFQERNIEGFLVGGASLEAGSFKKIIKEALRAHKEKK